MSKQPTWHSSREGPWWKCLRISIFGLTETERSENLESMMRMRARLEEEGIEEDLLFDEYAALPNRPKIKMMLRETEDAPLQEHDVIDLDDFKKWRAQRANVYYSIDAAEVAKKL